MTPIIDPKTIILDPEEQALEDEFLAGKYIPAASLDTEREKHQHYGKNTTARTQVTIRPYAKDIAIIKMKALQAWIPYQTYINSVLHQFATGQLKTA